jgi:hypothetical protein
VRDVMNHSIGVTMKFARFAAGGSDHPRTPRGDLVGRDHRLARGQPDAPPGHEARCQEIKVASQGGPPEVLADPQTALGLYDKNEPPEVFSSRSWRRSASTYR